MAKHRILIVEDEKNVRETLALILQAADYTVTTAEHGFDALLQLKGSNLPNLIISDLNMPHMSGFEFLSVVRRRFPHIPVIASSGAYHSGDSVPGGIIADGFYAKVGSGPDALLSMVSTLLATSADRMLERHTGSAPVWIPRNGKDSQGIPFIVVTCPDCLRSFPLSVLNESIQEIQETECLFCPTQVRYIVDFSRDVASPRKPSQQASIAAAAGSRTKR
jgi:CheY-like chemotaxis protein